MLANKVLLLALELSRNCNRTLALEKPNHRGNGILRRNFNTPVHMLGHLMPLNHPAFLLAGQLMKNRFQKLANLTKHDFATVLGYKHNMLLTVPLRVLSSYGTVSSSHRGSYFTPGTLKA